MKHGQASAKVWHGVRHFDRTGVSFCLTNVSRIRKLAIGVLRVWRGLKPCLFIYMVIGIDQMLERYTH